VFRLTLCFIYFQTCANCIKKFGRQLHGSQKPSLATICIFCANIFTRFTHEVAGKWHEGAVAWERASWHEAWKYFFHGLFALGHYKLGRFADWKMACPLQRKGSLAVGRSLGGATPSTCPFYTSKKSPTGHMTSHAPSGKHRGAGKEFMATGMEYFSENNI